MPKEIYYYNIVDLEKKKNKTKHSNYYYTSHIHGNLYDKNYKIVGTIFSVNNHFINGKICYVTTLTTYITPKGTFVCNWNYSTGGEYLFGKKETIPTFKDGKYEKKNLKLELEGIDDENGTRELTISY